jgi:hypothetical protein
MQGSIRVIRFLTPIILIFNFLNIEVLGKKTEREREKKSSGKLYTYTTQLCNICIKSFLNFYKLC